MSVDTRRLQRLFPGVIANVFGWSGLGSLKESETSVSSPSLGLLLLLLLLLGESILPSLCSFPQRGVRTLVFVVSAFLLHSSAASGDDGDASGCLAFLSSPLFVSLGASPRFFLLSFFSQVCGEPPNMPSVLLLLLFACRPPTASWLCCLCSSSSSSCIARCRRSACFFFASGRRTKPFCPPWRRWRQPVCQGVSSVTAERDHVHIFVAVLRLFRCRSG